MNRSVLEHAVDRHVETKIRCNGMYGLLCEVVAKGAVASDPDLLERIREAIAEHESQGADNAVRRQHPIINYDTLTAEIVKEASRAESRIAEEKLAGNVVKQAGAEGELIAFNLMHSWIERLKGLK